MVITLERHEIVAVINAAIARYASAANNRQMRGIQTMNPWERILLDIDGAGAEMAVAKHLGIYWGSDFGHNGVDIKPNIDVKFTKHLTGRLLVFTDADPDRKYVLVTGGMPTYNVIGWMLGHDAKKEEYLDTPDRRRPPVYAVPQERLNRFHEQ